VTVFSQSQSDPQSDPLRIFVFLQVMTLRRHDSALRCWRHGRDVNLNVVADTDTTLRVTSSLSQILPRLPAAENRQRPLKLPRRACSVAPSGLATLTPHYLVKYRRRPAQQSEAKQSKVKEGKARQSKANHSLLFIDNRRRFARKHIGPARDAIFTPLLAHSVPTFRTFPGRLFRPNYH